RSGVVLGTPAYMAPEQAWGRNKEVGPATDVYALGAILYECLTGKAPFRGNTGIDIILQVLGTAPKPPRHLRADIPEGLELVCLRCREKGHGERYSSAAELAEELGRFLSGEAVEAVRRKGRWRRRWLLAVGVVGVLALMVPGGGTSFRPQASEEEDPRDPIAG